MVEVLKLEGLRVIQKVDVATQVLDVAIHKDVMYISLNASEGSWVEEYGNTNDGWTKLDTERWRILKREDSLADLNWLESMRKRVGHPEDE